MAKGGVEMFLEYCRRDCKCRSVDFDDRDDKSSNSTKVEWSIDDGCMRMEMVEPFLGWKFHRRQIRQSRE